MACNRRDLCYRSRQLSANISDSRGGITRGIRRCRISLGESWISLRARSLAPRESGVRRAKCAAAEVYGWPRTRPRLRESEDLCCEPAGGMQRSVSDRPSYLHLWHEFLNKQPKRLPAENPVSEILRACTFFIRVNTIRKLYKYCFRFFLFIFIRRFREKSRDCSFNFPHSKVWVNCGYFDVVSEQGSNSFEESYVKDEGNDNRVSKEGVGFRINKV